MFRVMHRVIFVLLLLLYVGQIVTLLCHLNKALFYMFAVSTTCFDLLQTSFIPVFFQQRLLIYCCFSIKIRFFAVNLIDYFSWALSFSSSRVKMSLLAAFLNKALFIHLVSAGGW